MPLAGSDKLGNLSCWNCYAHMTAGFDFEMDLKLQVTGIVICVEIYMHPYFTSCPTLYDRQDPVACTHRQHDSVVDLYCSMKSHPLCIMLLDQCHLFAPAI